MKKLMLLGLILIVILISGCAQQNSIVSNIENNKSANNASTTNTPAINTSTTIQIKSGLKITIKLPQNVSMKYPYAVGNWTLEWASESKSKSIIGEMYTITGFREEGSEILNTTSYGYVNVGLRISEGINWRFDSPGNYIFEVEIYNCSQIEETFKVDCFGSIYNRDNNYNIVKAKIQPIINATEIITVE